jgi:FlaA1/EpsC-like NDP-sugar epimerase
MKLHIRSTTTVIMHDLFMAALAWQAAWWIRFNLDFPYYNWQLSLYTLPLVLIIQGLVYNRFKLHRGLWRFASLPDLWNIFRAAVFGAVFITLVLFIWIRLEGIPRSILILYPVLLMFLLGGPRLAYRMWKDHSFNLKPISGGKRVLIVGAGRAGEMLIRDMLRDGQYTPVGFVDDNPALQDAEIHGIRVLGKTASIPEISRQKEPDIIVLAVPSANSEQMQAILSRCEETGLPLRTLPKMQDMVSGQVTINELREVSIEDLLGREKVELDWNIIQQGLGNKVVLVSGGGGSIGSELCKQIVRLNPAALVIFERSEFNLYNIDRILSSAGQGVKIYPVLGDLCDMEKVDHVVRTYKPDVIFHAAAYKHVPILQLQAREAVKNNILATRYLADSAIKNQCNKFVFISTDKAVNPANVLGSSKRIAEMYCEWKNQQAITRFITVRFGNVLDSDGSVVPLFREQIRKGGPVTVTHPEITRFFMTIPEASQLIMQAGAMGKGGEIFVLDMGKPVKITYLAEQMIKLSGRRPGQDIRIVYTGLRAGEKLHEELFYANESRASTDHPKILLARHSEIDWSTFAGKISELEKACLLFDEDKLRSLLEELVPVHLQEAREKSNVISLDKART